MNLIVSADRRWGIGRAGDLLFRRPGDMAFFREKTLGKVIVMGRRTLESLPGGKPLPKRTSLVLTRDRHFVCQGAQVFHDLEGLLACLASYPDEDIFVIGGGQVYRLLLPYCRRALITRWEADGDADTFLPDFDHSAGWRLEQEGAPVTEEGVTYRFCTYCQDGPKPWRLEESV